MSGFTKNHYVRFISETKCQLKEYLGQIEPVLPYEYNKKDIISVIEVYYPYEWRIIVERYKEYSQAEKKLQKFGKRPRYKMPTPEHLLFGLKVTKHLLSPEHMEWHRSNYFCDERVRNVEQFISIRKKKVSKRDDRIKKALERAQCMEPEFLERLMGLYDRKNVSQKDKVYIIKELEKYYCPKVVNFFKKIAHSEINFQLREEAVHHLLSLGHFAELRKQKYMKVHVKNRNKRQQVLKKYAKERFSIEAIPEELEYRIHNSAEQNIKLYDYFISHSSADHDAVQTVIDTLNKRGINVYCDWISDSDYLKRHLVCDATLDVIEKRLHQSTYVLFIASENSFASIWVKYELNYFHDLGRKIFYIDISSIAEEDINIDFIEMKDTWYIDTEYKSKNFIHETRYAMGHGSSGTSIVRCV